MRRVPCVDKLHALTGFRPRTPLNEIIDRVAASSSRSPVPQTSKEWPPPAPTNSPFSPPARPEFRSSFFAHYFALKLLQRFYEFIRTFIKLSINFFVFTSS